MNPIQNTLADELKLLQQWHNGIKIFQVGHLRAAAYYKCLGRIIGLVATIGTVIISTSVFNSLSSSRNEILLIVTGVISVIAAVLVGLQTFLNYPEQGGKHQTAGLRYGRLRRRVEEIQVFVKNPEELKKIMQAIRIEWEQLDEESPELPQRFHDKALKMMRTSIAHHPEDKKNNK